MDQLPKSIKSGQTQIRTMQQKEHQIPNQQKITITFPPEAYPGVCNLCFSSQTHTTLQCSFSTVLYHATNLSALVSIAENNLHPHKGRLGQAIYCSDNPEMCLRYVFKNRAKFPQPVLLRIKALLTEIKTVNSSQEVKTISHQSFKSEGIQCIKCPYFKINGQTLYQYAIYKADYAIVGWSRIKFPGVKPIEQKIDIEKPENHQDISIKQKSEQSQISNQPKKFVKETKSASQDDLGKQNQAAPQDIEDEKTSLNKVQKKCHENTPKHNKSKLIKKKKQPKEINKSNNYFGKISQQIKTY